MVNRPVTFQCPDTPCRDYHMKECYSDRISNDKMSYDYHMVLVQVIDTLSSQPKMDLLLVNHHESHTVHVCLQHLQDLQYTDTPLKCKS